MSAGPSRRRGAELTVSGSRGRYLFHLRRLRQTLHVHISPQPSLRPCHLPQPRGHQHQCTPAADGCEVVVFGENREKGDGADVGVKAVVLLFGGEAGKGFLADRTDDEC